VTPEVVAAERVIATFQPFFPRPLSKDEAGEIRRNLLGVIEMLIKWDREAHEQAGSSGPSSRGDEAGRPKAAKL
jgi:hypothetical protein